MATQIFVPGVGQHDNIGDIILRRQLLDWLRPAGALHIYVGASPDGYDEALGVQPTDVVYRSFSTWYRALLSSAAKGRASYVFKPGEIQLTLVGMKEHVGMLPALLVVRARGGGVVRVGVGSRNFAAVPRALMAPSIALSHMTLWRDVKTAKYMRGDVMPDLAFGEGTHDAIRRESGRDALVVSMRSDRPYPSDIWLKAVRTVAETNGLEIVAVTQVLRDSERSRQLATDLGGTVVDWNGIDHGIQEDKLRELYQRTSLVVSDRLHVLIGAATEGAAPAALLTDGSDKIDRHFDAVGVNGVSLRTTGVDEADLIAFLTTRSAARAEVAARLISADEELGRVRQRVLANLDRGRAARSQTDSDGRRDVWHVGRVGEVAGGMTQVLNGYVAWPFESSSIHVIRSRDGSRGLRGIRRFLRAFGAVLRIPKKSGSVVVVHLSQGGSFVREGVLLRLAAARGFSTVAQLHGSSFADFAAKNRRKVASVLARADVVHVLSPETEKVVRSLLPRVEVVLIPNAVAPGEPAEKQKTVVFGGSVSRRKGIPELLEAWRTIGAEFPEWRLRIAGPVAEESLVANLPAGVAILGSLPHEALLHELDVASVAVLPSLDEAMPMFILEAMARRCCVVATTVGGIPEVLGNGEGVLVSPGDSGELVDALRSVLSSPERRNEHGDAAHRSFQTEFSMAAVAPRLEDMWQGATLKTRNG